MKVYPESATVQLEFDKIKSLLHEKCRTEYAKTKAQELRIHTKKRIHRNRTETNPRVQTAGSKYHLLSQRLCAESCKGTSAAEY